MSLDNLRTEIDDIDRKLVELFEKRMATSAKIAEVKQGAGTPVLDRSREAEKLAEITAKVPPELRAYAHILYDTLFELSRSHQYALGGKKNTLQEEIQTAMDSTEKLFPPAATVACQGVMGAYSQTAAEKLFKRPNIQYVKTFEAVFSAIENGFCEYGVLPLENSTAGSVTKIYNLMQSRNFKIVRSARVKIDHNLVAKAGVKLSDIREIISHEQALSQCAAYMERLGVEVKITAVANTAQAAQMVAESERRDLAAICSSACISLYGLHAIAHDIQDKSNNYTRFICISKNLEIYPGADRTSMMLVVPHKPGSLYKVLARFYALGINLNKLESRPLPDRDFQFMFYFDLETSVYSEEFAILMGSLEEICDEFKYLGSYVEVL